MPDPYYLPPVAPPPAPVPPDLPLFAGPSLPPRPPTVSPLALSAVLAALLMGPVGAILAMIFGWYARRDVERERRARGERVGGAGYVVATVGLALGVALTPLWGAALSYLAWTRTLRADVARHADPAPPVPAPPRAPVAPRPAPVSPLPPLMVAPAHTQVERTGRITVVDLGRATASLSEELPRQRAAATTAGERLVVMTTTGRCAPCRGVDDALRDPLMQTALARVRLIRVDADVFSDDLEALRIPHVRIPGFFLLAPDLSPRDGIDGGEWGDDIAANMAPVLGAFVRGQYSARREPWRPLPGGGMAL